MASSSSPFHRVGTLLLLLFLCISSVVNSQPLTSSQAKTLLRVHRLLGYSAALAALPTAPDPCALPPTPALTVACAGGQVTALSVRGDRDPDPAWRTAMPSNFSAALFTTLTRLSALTRLSLVALGDPLPGAKLRRLQALNLSSNYLYGAVPEQVSRMYSLQDIHTTGDEVPGMAVTMDNKRGDQQMPRGAPAWEARANPDNTQGTLAQPTRRTRKPHPSSSSKGYRVSSLIGGISDCSFGEYLYAKREPKRTKYIVSSSSTYTAL